MSSRRIPNRARRHVGTALAALLVLSAATAGAQERALPRPPSGGGLPKGLTAEYKALTQDEDGNYVFGGPVTLIWEDTGTRFQADRVVIREERWLEAEGNVLLVWGTNRVAGTSAIYDMEEDWGIIRDAVGQVDPEYQFSAKEARIVGDDLLYLKKAEVTTCNQPVPYWSFRVSKARVRVNGYARMLNPRLKIRKVPVFYLPYMVWPIKEDRAIGLLLPEIGNTQNVGQVITQPLFVPIGRSADVTVIGRYYSLAGFGLGAQSRFVPNQKGSGWFDGFFIDDNVSAQEEGVDHSYRYRFTYQQNQTFRNGFRMVSDVNVVSDFDYFNDFERDLDITSTPNIRTRIEFVRNGRWLSMAAREDRNNQLFSNGTSLVQQALPEIEWRGRSRKLGRTPMYITFDSSVALIQQFGTKTRAPIDADYFRGDVFPTLTIPVSKIPWIDINPRGSYRLTYWTQQQREFAAADGEFTRTILDEPLTRKLGGAGIEIIGPKIYRIFDTPDSRFSQKWKNTFETTVAYVYREGFDRLEDVISYDEVDRFGSAGNSVTYGLRTRLFAQRPRSSPSEEAVGGSSIVMPGMPGSYAREAQMPTEEMPDQPSTEEEAEPEPEERVLEPVQIATLEVLQARSFQTDLSTGDLDGDGVDETTTQRSDIRLSGRFNPNPVVSLDIRSNYQVVYNRFRDATLSGRYANPRGRVQFSLVFRNGLGVVPTTIVDEEGNSIQVFVPREDDLQLKLSGGVNLLGGRMRLDGTGAFVSNPSEGASRFPERQWRIQYATQCCTFLIERLVREFTGVQNREDFYFRVDLRGIGKILDQRF